LVSAASVTRAGRQVIPRLRTVAETDPDGEIPRLAGLSLK
jgi:hypothetical protein